MALADELFASIDTIVQARIANLSYDQTIECNIIDISKANQGIYLVSSQATKFEASGNTNAYNIDDVVYVQIPQNDFKKDKIILGKKIDNTLTGVNKIEAFSTFIYNKNKNYFENSIIQKEYNILTTGDNNSSIKEIPIIKFETPIAGYTKLGLKFSVSSNINKEMLSGKYGLYLVFKGYDQSQTYLSFSEITPQTIGEELQYGIFSDNMVVENPYQTYGWCNQEKIFDISNLVITEINAYIWQDGNFLDTENNLIEKKPIVFSNFKLFIGYSEDDLITQNALYKNNNIKQENINKILYTLDGLQYNEQNNTKQLKSRILKYDNQTQTELEEIEDSVTSMYQYYNIQDKQQYKEEISEIKFSNLKDFKQQTESLFIYNNDYVSNIIIFTNINFIEDQNLLSYLSIRDDKIKNNLNKIVQALKKIDSSIDITLE